MSDERLDGQVPVSCSAGSSLADSDQRRRRCPGRHHTHPRKPPSISGPSRCPDRARQATRLAPVWQIVRLSSTFSAVANAATDGFCQRRRDLPHRDHTSTLAAAQQAQHRPVPPGHRGRPQFVACRAEYVLPAPLLYSGRLLTHPADRRRYIVFYPAR